MELRLGMHRLDTGTGIVVARPPAGGRSRPPGAQVVDVGVADTGAMAAARAAHPDAAVCVTVYGRGDTQAAIGSGAELLLIGDRAALRAAAASPFAVAVPGELLPLAAELGVVPPRLVRYLPGPCTLAEVAEAAAGAPVLLDADAQAPDEAGILAAACVLTHGGATLLRTAHPAGVRLALDMLAAIRGVIAPAAPRRALG